MQADELHIGIAMSRNSEKYFDLLATTAKLTASDPDRIVYYLGINHGADEDRVRSIVRALGVRAVIFLAHVDSGYSSMNHGLCLDIVFSRMTSRYCMLVDCDVAFIMQDWDVAFLSMLDSKNVIVGSEYDGDKYMGFPNVICAAFDADVIRGLGISFKPEGRITLDSPDILELYGYDRNSSERSIILDTGSELPRKIKASGLKGIPIQLVRAGDQRARFMIDGLRGEEYQLNSKPVITHIGRSFTRERGVDADAVAWERRIWEWLHVK